MGIENQVVDGKISYGLTGLSKTFYSLVDDKKFKSTYINMLLYLYEIYLRFKYQRKIYYRIFC